MLYKKFGVLIFTLENENAIFLLSYSAKYYLRVSNLSFMTLNTDHTEYYVQNIQTARLPEVEPNEIFPPTKSNIFLSPFLSLYF